MSQDQPAPSTERQRPLAECEWWPGADRRPRSPHHDERRGRALAMTVVPLAFALASLSCRPSQPRKEARSANALVSSLAGPPSIVNAPNWEVTTDTSRLDGAIKTHIVHDEGDYSLVIRILNGRITDFYVRTPTPVTDREGTVRVRFKLDSGPILAQPWSSAEDYRGIFAPDPYWFVKQLRQSSSLVFEYRPWLTDTKEVSFKTAGLSPILSHVIDSTYAALTEDSLRRVEADRVERARRDSVNRIERAARARLARQRYVDSLKAIITEYGIDPCTVWDEEAQAAVGAKCH